MNYAFLRQQLTQNPNRMAALIEGVTPSQAQWKPSPDAWSILEVINHLYDEEREDFRVRLDIILHHAEDPWPPIDPQGWVTSRAYNQRDLKQSLTNFLTERQNSLAWLQSLSNPNWQATYQAPFGPITAGDMFTSWVTHDQLHMRQLIELHRLHTETAAAPYNMRYAGIW